MFAFKFSSQYCHAVIRICLPIYPHTLVCFSPLPMFGMVIGNTLVKMATFSIRYSGFRMESNLPCQLARCTTFFMEWISLKPASGTRMAGVGFAPLPTRSPLPSDDIYPALSRAYVSFSPNAIPSILHLWSNNRKPRRISLRIWPTNKHDTFSITTLLHSTISFHYSYSILLFVSTCTSLFVSIETFIFFQFLISLFFVCRKNWACEKQISLRTVCTNHRSTITIHGIWNLLSVWLQFGSDC